MAERSKALPLTVNWVWIRIRACEKVFNDLGLEAILAGYASFLKHLQMASQD